MRVARKILSHSLFLMLLSPLAAQAAVLNDYCVVPPFIQEIAKPNLLMIIDNSASMYDLAYVDKGRKTCSGDSTLYCDTDATCAAAGKGTCGRKACSNNRATACTTDAQCGSGNTCTFFERQPYYCYDQTFSNANSYTGYFDKEKNYQYDFGASQFTEVASIPASCAVAASSTETGSVICKIRPDVVHVNMGKGDASGTKYFYASGKYLNWITASKFDVEKKVLTGGKYVAKVCSGDSNKSCLADGDCATGDTCVNASSFMQPESRGCVGRQYVKEALTSDFINYTSDADNTNTSLQLAFTVQGPPNPVATAPTSGGQTYISVFGGKDYDFGKCQAAIDAIAAGGNAAIKSTVADCLTSTAPTEGSCQQDTSKSCTTSSQCVKNAAYSTTTNVCSGATNLSCTSDANCSIPATTTCAAKSSMTCSSGSDCVVSVVEKLGTCGSYSPTLSQGASNQFPSSCRTNANCSFSHGNTNYTGTCSGYVAPSSTDYGPCQSTLAQNFGTCVANYIGPCNLPDASTKTNVSFQQSMQACWQYRQWKLGKSGAQDIGIDDINTVINQCSDVYGSLYTCSNNTQQTCGGTDDTSTCGAGTCVSGPAAVGPGNPALICGQAWEGQYFEQKSGAWVLKSAYTASSPALKTTHQAFCDSLDTPAVVTDPTDSPSDTSVSENLPAILSGIGLEAQMGTPFATMRVRVAANTPPSGLVQEFENKIRIGLMAFNRVGSKTEVDSSLLPATKVCSNAPDRTCAAPADCGTGAGISCNAVTDKDGAQVLSLVGIGHCKVSTGTACTKSAHCPTGEVCVSDSAGTHTSTGLIHSIDTLRASTWTPFAEAFYNAIGYFAVSPSDATGKTSRTDLRLNGDDFPSGMNPSEYVCQSNNVLLVTDGSSTADQSGDVGTVVDTYKSVSGNVTGACSKYAGSKNLDDLAWLARHRNINDFDRTSASTAVPVKKNQMISTYVVFNGADNGESSECDNTTLLTNTANKGGTELLRADIPDQYQTTLRKAFEAVAGGTASGTAASILSNSEGSGANILQAVFYPSKDFETAAGQTSPTYARWIGEVQNLWYYVDPFIGNSTVREDTNTNKDLDIVNDYVVDFQFKGGETLAVLTKDTNGDGAGDTVVTTAMDARVQNQGFCTNSTTPTSSSYSKCATDAGCLTGETCVVQGVANADDVHSLWRAGRTLWERNLDSSQRKLYTYLYGTSAPGCTGTFSVNGLYDLADINWATINANDKCILKSVLQATSDDEAKDILKFAEGYDHQDYDSSTGKITGTIDGKKPRNRSVQRNSVKKVWKLGDIIASTPRIQSFNKLNNYHLDAPAGYGDTTYANEATKTGFTNSTAYKGRGMAYAGANDGMLHAFKLGSLTVSGTGAVKATLGPVGATDLGKEEWAFLPKHVLPYLKYLADPDYSHLYLVDGPTRLVDASIGADYAAATAPYDAAGCNDTEKKYWACKRDGATTDNKSWRSILIGSMGVGGASANLGATCTDCVKAPVDGVGYSSYFALDITNPGSPTYLWEYSDTDLGAATSGAAVVRVAHTFTAAGGVYGKEGSTATNGRWFAVLGNGPSGPIDTTYHQFKAKSKGPLRVYILDLLTGAPLGDPIDTTIANAFAGAIGPGTIDTDRSKRTDPGFYTDDAVYFGYTNCTANCGTDTPTWDGGIMRLLTNESSDVSTWSLSTLVSGIGPVTTAVSKIQDRKNHNLWLYTGTGRYFFKGDDSSAAGKIFAVKEPCYDAVNDDIYKQNIIDGQSPRCTTGITFSTSDFANQTSSINSVDGKKGWYIDLGAEDTTNKYGAERIITEPVVMGNGAVFFTSFMPSTDICNYGGNSYLWGMRYNDGGAASAGQLKGKALVQVSTGSFEEIDLSSALTSNLNRRMAVPMVGKPPTDPPPIVSASGNKPLRRILHIQEK